jgi:hypothetical protein
MIGLLYPNRITRTGYIPVISLLFFILSVGVFSETCAQSAFRGSFMMSFSAPGNAKNDPFLWTVEQRSGYKKMALEIQDEMLLKGVRKRVVFDPADSTWTMLISFNKVKQGTRIHAAAMFRDTATHKPVQITKTKETKLIGKYLCKKMIVESEKYIAEVWYSDKIKFNLCGVYRLLSHCGMMSDVVRSGDWFTNRNLKTMVMEVTSTNKSTNLSYKMNISQVNHHVDSSFFDTKGFRIANIPEGQNCGIQMQE